MQCRQQAGTLTSRLDRDQEVVHGHGQFPCPEDHGSALLQSTDGLETSKEMRHQYTVALPARGVLA